MSERSQLRDAVCDANRALVAHGLVTLTWGNVSGITPSRDIVAIKPSGVPYERLRPHDIVLVDLEGRIVEGDLRPSTDTPTHLALYRAWPEVGGVTHTHSPYATMFAQARTPIPCLGTTHADHFAGDVPVTRQLTPEEVDAGYEAQTGLLILECFRHRDRSRVPAVLLPGHAPFVWGVTAAKSLENAVALEAIAHLAHGTLALGPHVPIEPHILHKHQSRKHGAGAYYGQAT
ncbi:MAG: L-ribulose-5-phosphate 4-epimerase AraD [Phycisphaerales bacterium]|nr:L-ribulose-5-phosphate 4-epimerase AraD [Phycisphaerales bacterium]